MPVNLRSRRGRRPAAAARKRNAPTAKADSDFVVESDDDSSESEDEPKQRRGGGKGRSGKRGGDASSSSGSEEDEPLRPAKRKKAEVQQRAQSSSSQQTLADPSDRLIASLEQMVEVSALTAFPSLRVVASVVVTTRGCTPQAQAKIIALKDDVIAAKVAENERLQRMVRSLELQ